MASDNGKAGEIDWYDVAGALEYLDRKYHGTTQITFSSALEGSSTRMLLCASFVGDEPTSPRGAASAVELPFAPGALRKVPELAHGLLLEMQEELDTLRPGELVVIG